MPIYDENFKGGDRVNNRRGLDLNGLRSLPPLGLPLLLRELLAVALRAAALLHPALRADAPVRSLLLGQWRGDKERHSYTLILVCENFQSGDEEMEKKLSPWF